MVKPKIILVTGFLGSGKTTLLNRLIEFYSSQKLGLIINDFGQIVVDGILLKDLVKNSDSKESSIYEISNGSIFCSCLSAELVKSLKYFADIKPNVLLIETSGLSDPSTFGKILEENKLDKVYDVVASFCLFDAVRSMKLSNKIVAIEKQIKSSNIIVVNKTDLISENEYSEIEKFILSKNKNAELIKTTFANMNLSILNSQINIKFISEVGTCNTVTSRPGSIVLVKNEVTENSLNKFYEIVKNKIFRIKGFLIIEGDTYFISDNNYKLQIQKSDKHVELYGLSVLLPTDTIDFVENNWDNIFNNKIIEVTNE